MMGSNPNKRTRNRDVSDNSSDETEEETNFDELDECMQRKLIFNKLISLERRNGKLLGTLTKDVDELKTKVAVLEKENQKLREEINLVKQMNLSNSVVFYGIPDKTDVADVDIVTKVATKLGLDVTERDISDTFRLSVKSKEGSKHPPLVSKFVRQVTKTNFIKAKGQKNLKTSDIGLGGESKWIFVNEYLTRNNNDLLKYAKQLRDHDYKYVWPSKGRVLVKKQEGGKAIVIKDKSMVDKLLNNK